MNENLQESKGDKSEKATLFQTGSFVPWLSYDDHFGEAETDTKLPVLQKGMVKK